MDKDKLKSLLAGVKTGRVPVDKALETLKTLPFEDLDFAKVDHHRGIRNGLPEVIFAQNKKNEEVVAIARSMAKTSGRFLITRASEKLFIALKMKKAVYHKEAGVISYGANRDEKGSVLVISAGTSDIPVAEEARVTAAFLGSRTNRLYDVGVAGIHRVLCHHQIMSEARVIIVVAGMEGALPSVVGGLTDSPVIAVPTSVGYGTSLGGLTALFSMLNSCVPGIAVVNIDNGFGAGCLAHRINMMGA